MKNRENTTTKIKIHFILPGGGVKGCFQAGFLYRLYKTSSSRYAWSAGALLAVLSCTGSRSPILLPLACGRSSFAGGIVRQGSAAD